ncbi:hypothetical protein [Spirillospora sp. CA-128828]|uniref:hypothetical protein n=1 Tax=Spirillospora sp. CA-128828 TaxID=3240033 RepID=UPI003D8E7943
MSRERSLTLEVLSAAAPHLALAIAELNSKQRRAARVERYFVVIEHELDGPAEELRPWPGEEGLLYRFNQQHFAGDWGVESGETTLGYSLHLMRCSTGRTGMAQRILGGWRRRSVHEGAWARLLVVDDGVPALFLGGKRYSGGNKGWRHMLQDLGWPELQS